MGRAVVGVVKRLACRPFSAALRPPFHIPYSIFHVDVLLRGGRLCFWVELLRGGSSASAASAETSARAFVEGVLGRRRRCLREALLLAPKATPPPRTTTLLPTATTVLDAAPASLEGQLGKPWSGPATCRSRARG